MKKISVIVPVYNVRNYLNKCLNSILNQTYKNLEIILIDDGSTDDSGNICDEFAKSDNRIIVIHKQNGGLSDARNVGIENATGDFLTFIDSDDYVEETMIMDLYNSCKEYGTDISCCGKIVEFPNKTIISNCNSDFFTSNENALLRMLTFDDIDVSAWAKLYSKRLFDGIHYPVGRYYEDIATTYKLFSRANSISHISKPDYHYIIRCNSILNSNFSSKHFDSVFFADELKKYICLNFPDISDAAESYYILSVSDTIQKIVCSNKKNTYKKEYNELHKILKTNLLKSFKNRYIPLYKKVMLVLMAFRCYKIVFLLKKMK